MSFETFCQRLTYTFTHSDLHVPIVPSAKIDVPYEEAIKLVLDAVTPLGTEYKHTASLLLNRVSFSLIISFSCSSHLHSFRSFYLPCMRLLQLCIPYSFILRSISPLSLSTSTASLDRSIPQQRQAKRCQGDGLL